MLYVYWAAVNVSTRDTPFYLNNGHDAPNLTELPNPTELAVNSSIGEYKLQLTRNVNAARKLGLTNIHNAQQKQKDQYDDLTRQTVCLLPGDIAYSYDPAVPTGKSSKLHRFWHGPFRVVHVTADGTNATLRYVHAPNQATVRTHCNRLRLGKLRPEDQQDATPPENPQGDRPQPAERAQNHAAEERSRGTEDTRRPARMVTGHPHLPAVVLAESEISGPLARLKHNTDDVPVKFFHYDTVAWIPPTLIWDFGEDSVRYKNAAKTVGFRAALEAADEFVAQWSKFKEGGV